MNIREKKLTLNADEEEAMRRGEMIKAIVWSALTLLGITAIPGGVIGGILGWLLVVYGGDFHTSPPTAFGLVMSLLVFSIIIPAFISWFAGAIYTVKKWYNFVVLND